MQTGEGKNLKANFINAMQAKILSGELKPGDRLLSAHRAAQGHLRGGIRAPRHAGDAVGDNEL